MKRLTRVLALLLALTMVAAACGSDDDDGGEAAPVTTAAPVATDADASSDAAEASIAFDYGVDEDTVRIGAIADLSGIFSGLVTQIVDAQTVYWDMVNAAGGIGGKQVEFIVLDNAYDVPTHLERYEAMRDTGADGVVMLSQSTGSPHTAAIAEMAIEDNMAVIPLSWYSGWSDPDFGKNIFESYSNYCYEAMNGVDYLNRYMQEQGVGSPTLAIVSFPGEYGGDGAAGARLAAEALGIEVVADLGGTVIPGADNTPVISQLVEANADMVWTTLNPGTLTEAMLGASAQGYEPVWSGNVPSFSYLLLGGDVGPLLDTNYIANTYIVTWNTPNLPGLEKLKAEMTAAMPDAVVSDAYIIGWTEAMAAHQALEQAASNGDMTRAGVVRAFNEITVDYDGLAPNQSWGGGDVNDLIVRETYTYDVVLADYDAGATLAEGGGTGTVLVEGPRAADITKAHVYVGACDKAEAEASDAAEASIAFDYGVDEDTVRIGAIADLSGIFSGLVTQIVDAQTVYWDMVNAAGGIGGKQVEFIVLDNAYDVPTHLERYEAMRDTGADGVVMLSQSTGSPHTAAIAEMAIEDNMAVIPLSWYSGWSDPDFGKNIFESYSNYCYEAMNGVDYLNRYMQEQGVGSPTLAIVSFPGEYGGDGAAGARLAAEALGIEVVADLGGTVIPGADNTPVISQLVEANADMVWTTLNPGTLTEAMLGASAQGYEPVWSGNVPSFSYLLLGGDVGPLLDTNYIANTYIVTWNTPNLPGLEKLKAEMTAAMPDAVVSDAYIIGWTEAMAAHQALEQAASNGDMTRAGVVRAFNEITVDYDGLAPNQSWGGGDVNDLIVRETYTYDVVLADYDAGATLAEGGGTGTVLVEGPRAADITKAHVYVGACDKG